MTTKNAWSRFRVWARTGYVPWVLALCIALGSLTWSWHRLDHGWNLDRRDGNGGHATVDFAGPYLLGRMVLDGHGHALYDRRLQRRALLGLFPTSDEDPQQERSDVDRLMAWFLGTDEATQIDKVSAGMLPFGAIQPLAILAPTSLAMRACSAQASPCQCLGGPLYPPVAGLLYVPLSVWRPRIAYRLAQIGNLFCSLFAAVAIWQLSKKGYRLPFVWCLVLLFPGCIVSMSLGQNAAFSLSLLAWGWLLAKRGHDWSAGMVWGILVYKPVWLVAFFTVPVLSRRWTMAAAMAASSLLFVLLSLPFVGTQSWLNWLRLAPEAFETYRNDPTWIRHSRDLLSLPYQWSLATASAWNSILAAAGWSLLGAVMLTTFSVALCRPRSMTDATAAGCCFILLGAWLSCIHFMHYDVLLAALPVLILSARPHYRLPRVIHTFLAGCLLLTPGAPGWSGMAWETMAILMLWIWCGWQVWAGGIAPRWLPSLAEGQVVVRELSPTAMP